MVEPVALVALVLDAAVGWPDWLYRRVGHPVGCFAQIISAGDIRLNRRDWSDKARTFGGVATLAVLTGVVSATCLALVWLAHRIAGEHDWIVLALLASPALAQRSLDLHIAPVIEALRTADLARSRQAVGQIAGRDTACLDEAGVARAAIESLAESFCDGVIAPLFWLIIAGLPGIWVLKAINTADSLIGHKESPYRHFGWAAARFDDVMNFVPARLSALLICLAGLGGWETCLRFGHCHASPNAGWPEAAMAGVLQVRLAGPASYDGALANRPWIGDGHAAGPAALVRGRRVYHRACLLGWVLAGGTAWLA